MLSIPEINNKGRHSMINAQQAMPNFIYEPQMTLQDYIQGKNLQRRLEYKLLNIQYGGSNPLSQEKQYYFEKHLHDIKGFVMHIMGQGSLYNKFVTMIDNLYITFMKEITVYHQFKVQKQTQTRDSRFQEFKSSNQKISQYLKTVENEHKEIDSKLEYLKKTKELYKINRQNQLQKRLQKQKQKQKDLKKQIEQQVFKDKQMLLQTLNQQKKSKQVATLQIEPKKKLQAKKTQKEIEQYNKRRITIGKISNVFASFIHE